MRKKCRKTPRVWEEGGTRKSFAGRARFFKVFGARRLKNSSVFSTFFIFSSYFFQESYFSEYVDDPPYPTHHLILPHCKRLLFAITTTYVILSILLFLLDLLVVTVNSKKYVSYIKLRLSHIIHSFAFWKFYLPSPFPTLRFLHTFPIFSTFYRVFTFPSFVSDRKLRPLLCDENVEIHFSVLNFAGWSY